MREARLLNTEQIERWVVRRTYKADGESTMIRTLEIPESAIREFGYARLLRAIEKFERGRVKRKNSAIRKNAIIEGHEAGKNQSQIAREVGCSPAYVAHIIEMMS